MEDYQLSNQQANQSIGVGLEGARLADPFSQERGQYQNQLKNLVTNPGSFESSPYYQFSLNQGLNALQRKGTVRSGNKLAELMKYGQGLASQSYFPQANLLSTLSGATTGSPASAGLAYTDAYARSQNQKQLSQAQKGGPQQPGAGGAPLSQPSRDFYGDGGTGYNTTTGAYGGSGGYNTVTGAYAGGAPSGAQYGSADGYSGRYIPSAYAGQSYAQSGGYDPYGYADPYAGGYGGSPDNSSGGYSGGYDTAGDYGYSGFDDYGDY